ncbi:MAG: biotin--[acetyl-CoA-carboxylase] ligase, partial [Flavisolibacter sp.]
MSSLKPIGFPFIELPTVDSTNNYAMGLVHAGMAQHGMAVFTHDQTKGKGQRGKNWASQAGNNIALSVILEPKGLHTAQVFLLSKALALGALEFFNSLVREPGRIKWPNDLYWRDRKAGGILIENLIQGGEWRFAVAGIGLNLNQTDFGELDKKAVSVKQITGKEGDPLSLSRELCRYLETSYHQLLENPQAIAAAYQAHLYKRGEKARFKKDNRQFEATVRRVTDQ